MTESIFLLFVTFAIIFFLTMLVAVFLKLRWRVVPEMQRLVIYRLGHFQRIAGPGLIRTFERLDQVERELDISEKPHDIQTTTLFIYDIPFRFTLNFWCRFAPQETARNRTHLVQMVQFGNLDRKAQLHVKVHEAMVSSINKVLEQHTLPEDHTIIHKLLPIIPGLPDCQKILAHVKTELIDTLPSIGFIFNQAQPIAIIQLHLHDDLIEIFQRNRTVEELQKQIPGLDPEMIAQVMSSIEGKALPDMRVRMDGTSDRNVRMDFRQNGDKVESRLRYKPEKPNKAMHNGSKPSTATATSNVDTEKLVVAPDKRLSDKDLRVLKPIRRAG